jgi:glycerol uptake facilitator-like aquaporin
VVTLVFALRREIRWGDASLYVLTQFAAIIGVWLAHGIVAAPVLEVLHKLRDGAD